MPSTTTMGAGRNTSSVGTHAGVIEGVFLAAHLAALAQLAHVVGVGRRIDAAGQVEVFYPLLVALLLVAGMVVVVLRNQTDVVFGKAASRRRKNVVCPRRCRP
ncbi:MAG: hypothetical protein WKG07_24620 [Hymenobacter sp.]